MIYQEALETFNKGIKLYSKNALLCYNKGKLTFFDSQDTPFIIQKISGSKHMMKQPN